MSTDSTTTDASDTNTSIVISESSAITEKTFALLTSVDTLLKSLQKVHKRIAAEESAHSWYALSPLYDTVSQTIATQPLSLSGRYINGKCCYSYLAQLLTPL
jgi:hypothetical protein